MKKKLLLSAFALVLTFALLMTGCGINQGMADKINKKAKDGYTYEQLLKDYKNPTLDLTVGKTGTVFYSSQYKDEKEFKEKWDKGEKVKVVIVVVAVGKVVSATYLDGSKSDYKE